MTIHSIFSRFNASFPTPLFVNPNLLSESDALTTLTETINLLSTDYTISVHLYSYFMTCEFLTHDSCQGEESTPSA